MMSAARDNQVRGNIRNIEAVPCRLSINYYCKRYNLISVEERKRETSIIHNSRKINQ